MVAKSSKTPVRVRFAPSPTGPFSFGNARTALFNWLYVKHEGGKFLLRIEDTDKERSKPKFEKDIIDGLRWLGLEWDEEIYRQSNRLDLYEKYIKNLLDEGKAYYCFCSPDELEINRQTQLSQGISPKYSGECSNLATSNVEKRLKKEERAVIRFKMPEREISFIDLVRGKVKFNTELIGDIVIAKSPRMPLYNFAVVVDDHAMEITHVIRGEDHLSNTPKQLAIYAALGLNNPIYAHLPLILGPGRKKLSKRFLEHSLTDYKKRGYLPEAIFNFLLLLGWHPSNDEEIFNREGAIQAFNLSRVQKGGAIFDQEKLDWHNAYYIRHLETEKLLEYLEEFIPKPWYKNKKLLTRVLEIEKERMKKLTDFKELAGFCFELEDYDDELLIWKDNKKQSCENLRTIHKFIKGLSDDQFTQEIIKPFLEKLSEQWGRGVVYWPFRVALSSRKASPGALDIANVIGKKETMRRLAIALEKFD